MSVDCLRLTEGLESPLFKNQNRHTSRLFLSESDARSWFFWHFQDFSYDALFTCGSQGCRVRNHWFLTQNFWDHLSLLSTSFIRPYLSQNIHVGQSKTDKFPYKWPPRRRSISSWPCSLSLCFRIVFYRRVSPRTNLDMFTYIVCVECWNVNNSNLIHMLDFVQGGRRAKGVWEETYFVGRIFSHNITQTIESSSNCL